MLLRPIQACSLSWILLGCIVSPLWSAPKIDSLLPSTTVVLLDTDNVPEVRKAWNKTSLGQLFNDPAMQPFLDEVEQRNDAKVGGNVPPLGLWWEDVLDLSSGPAAMAIVPDGRKESSFVLIVDTTGNDATVLRVRERLGLDFRRNNAKAGALTIDGTAVQIYQYKDGPKADDPIETRYYFTKDKMLVVAESEFVVRDLLSRWAGKVKESLADQKAYQATTLAVAKGEAAGTPIIRCYIDPFGLHTIRHKPAAEESKRRSKPSTMDVLADNGFKVIQGIGGVIALGQDTEDILYKVKVYAPGELNSAARMLSFTPAKDLSPPAWFPADVSSVSSLHWKLGDAFAGYGSWFDADQGPGGEGTFEAILEDIKLDKNSPQVDIRADMVGQLSGPVFSASWVNPAGLNAAEGKTLASRWLYAAKTNDQKKVALALKKMLDGDPDILTPVRKLGAAEVWVYRPDSGETWLGPNLANVALSVIDGYAVVASDFDTMQQVMGSGTPAKSLVNDAGWKKIVPQVQALAASPPAVLQFRRLNQSWAESYALLQAGKIQEDDTLLGQALTMWLDQLADRKKVEEKKPATGGKKPLIPLKIVKEPGHDLDFTKLPEFKVLQKHLGLMASETELTAEGWQQNGIITAP